MPLRRSTGASPARILSPPRSTLDLARDLVLDRRRTKRNELMFLSSAGCRASRCPRGRTLTLASQRKRALLHVAVGDAEADAAARRSAAGTRSPRRRERRSGSQTISISGTPARLKSTSESPRRPWTFLPASSSMWMRSSATLRQPPSIDTRARRPRRAAGRTARSGSPSAGPGRSSACARRCSRVRDLAAERPCRALTAISTARAVQRPAACRAARGRPGRCACWARAPNAVEQPQKILVCVEQLRVHLEADDRFEVGDRRHRRLRDRAAARARALGRRRRGAAASPRRTACR